MKLVADINIPYLKGVLEPYFNEVVYLPGNKITREAVRDAEALLVRTRTICNEALLGGSKVRFIGSATIGFDHIDTQYCEKEGIVWATAPGCNSGGVLQWVVCALLQLSQEKNFSLEGKVLGVVGVGNVGRRIAKAGEALGLQVLCCDPPRKRDENLSEYVDFRTATQDADIITFHVPLSYSGNDATYHLVNDDFFKQAKASIILLNSSRGEVVETSSLVKGIRSGRVIASALDVWEGEPSVPKELVDLVDIATPHIAGYSLEGKVNGTRMVVDALSNFFKLSINPWRPSPNPAEQRVSLGFSADLKSVAFKTYDIRSDDKVFRHNPDAFELQRNGYNFRREFSAHDVLCADSHLAEVLKKLGFTASNQ